jgi:lipopolysaccharide biosynthesis glycosyltransferase
MSNEQFSVFTVCNIAYLPKALVLAKSLHEHHGQKLHVYVFDRKQQLKLPEEHVHIHWMEDLEVPNFYQMAFMYDIIEFSTSLKPYIAQYLLQNTNKVIFLDPDTAIFSSLESILEDLDQSPVVLTPHYRKPQPDTENESDLAMMRFGSFNLGFFAVRKSSEAEEFLSWWNRRCIDFSFMESQFGLSTDQKWVSIAPCFFDFLKISFNSGYNAAPWNTFERKITKKVNGKYFLEDGSPLVFFHFSNFDHSDPQYLNKRASSERNISYELLEELGIYYSRNLKAMESAVEKVPYSFDYMSDGSYISPTLRRAYASIKQELPHGHNPFDSGGPVGSFATYNNLLEKNNLKYAYPSLKEAAKHGRKFLLVYFLMRQALRVLGPNRFYDLSKLMVYLSIYRKNANLWKIK